MTHRDSEADARIAIDDLLRAAAWAPRDKSQVGTEILASPSEHRPQIATRAEARPFDTHAPVYDLSTAAGAFGSDRNVGATTDEVGWMAVPSHVRLTRDHFVAQVVGRSMEPTIPDGAHCLFHADRGGSREGRLVLVWHRGCIDPALGGEFSVKRYRSTKVVGADGSWSHREIRLEPLNSTRIRPISPWCLRPTPRETCA